MKIALFAESYIPAPPRANSIFTMMQEDKYFLYNIGHQVDIFNYKDVNELIDKRNMNIFNTL